MRLGSFKNVVNKMCLEIIYIYYIYKEKLATLVEDDPKVPFQ